MVNEKELITQKIDKIKENSLPFECAMVAHFYKNKDLYFDYYNKYKSLLKNNMWKFYFDIGYLVVKNKYDTINDLNIRLSIKNKKDLLDTYNEYGGFDKIEPVLDSINNSDFEGNITNLKKSSILLDIIKKFYLSDKRLKEFLAAPLDDVLGFIQVNASTIVEDSTSSSKCKISNLCDGLEEIIEEADKGENIGLPIRSEILNDEIGGLRLGELILVAGGTGTGKSTVTLEVYLSSIWDYGENCVVFLNEQDDKKWKQQFLTWIINNKIIKDKNKHFSSKRWIKGGFTDEEKEYLKEASKQLQEKMTNNKILLVELEQYSASDVISKIKKYATLGYKYFCLDTFKISCDYTQGDGQTWFAMQEDMRKFYDITKPSGLNINFWITCQLDKVSHLKRYLSRTDVGMSKNILDVASVCLLLRNIHNDEYADGKNPILVKTPLENTNSSTTKKLDDTEQNYAIIFIDKNRNGSAGSFQIVAEQNLGTLVYKEIGKTIIPFGT